MLPPGGYLEGLSDICGLPLARDQLLGVVSSKDRDAEKQYISAVEEGSGSFSVE